MIHELLAFPKYRHDDQVDSTVFALAWSTLNPPYRGLTKESIDGYSNLVNALWQDAMFGRLAGRPW